jgi:hypothetical protein
VSSSVSSACLWLLYALLQVQLHEQSLTLTLPCNPTREHALALRLSSTLLHPQRLTLRVADRPRPTDVGEALSIPELATTLSDLKELWTDLPCSLNLAAVSDPALCIATSGLATC